MLHLFKNTFNVKGLNTMAAEYNNDNKGALFAPKSEKSPCDLSGIATIEGDKFFVDYFKSNGRSRGVLILKDADDTEVMYVCVLRPSDKGKSIMFGSFKIYDDEFAVSVFQNEPKTERSPLLSLTFFNKSTAKKDTPKCDDIPLDLQDLPF